MWVPHFECGASADSASEACIYVRAVRSLPPLRAGFLHLSLAPVVANLRTIARGAGIIRRSSLIQFSFIAASRFLPYPQGQEDLGGLVPVGRLALPMPAKSGYSLSR